MSRLPGADVCPNPGIEMPSPAQASARIACRERQPRLRHGLLPGNCIPFRTAGTAVAAGMKSGEVSPGERPALVGASPSREELMMARSNRGFASMDEEQQ